MIERLTIVMYHYVRDVERTAFPGIKALSVGDFRGQLEYIRAYYKIISAGELTTAIRDKDYRLPANALLLTFDDGYADHVDNVLPILNEFAVSGIFIPVAAAVLEGRVLDVNKIHFTLASTSDNVAGLVDELFGLLDRYRSEFNLETNDYYYSRLAQAGRFDPPEVIFVKRMLQRDLPEQLRSRIVDELFRKYVTADEQAFAAELYMNVDQLKRMADAGMKIAAHSYDHCWLGTLPPSRQAEQIDQSLSFLRSIGASGATDWMFCYPYGSWNRDLVEILRERGCVAAFTTEVEIATGASDPLLLPRIDTNDLPKAADAGLAEWTKRVQDL